MTDYRRMEWQYRANRIAEITRVCCLWCFIPEVAAAISFHFRTWIVTLLAITALCWLLATFVDRYTRMYRAVD